MRQVDQQRLRFIDEAGVNTAMTRLYGRAPRGQRVPESVPRNYGLQTSIISAVSLDGAEATMTIEGAVDTATFDAYIEQVLRPTIRPDDVIVLDNLSAHRASRLELVAEQCGAQVLWLAPYSPDFSPIELMWSKIKTAVRAAKARTAGELNDALVAALQLVTKADCLGWFSHCGYQVTSNRN
ncbi:MAG: IS630 family transposase [Pyrinomonadaceae bacterium]